MKIDVILKFLLSISTKTFINSKSRALNLIRNNRKKYLFAD